MEDDVETDRFLWALLVICMCLAAATSRQAGRQAGGLAGWRAGSLARGWLAGEPVGLFWRAWPGLASVDSPAGRQSGPLVGPVPGHRTASPAQRSVIKGRASARSLHSSASAAAAYKNVWAPASWRPSACSPFPPCLAAHHHHRRRRHRRPPLPSALATVVAAIPHPAGPLRASIPPLVPTSALVRAETPLQALFGAPVLSPHAIRVNPSQLQPRRPIRSDRLALLQRTSTATPACPWSATHLAPCSSSLRRRLRHPIVRVAADPRRAQSASSWRSPRTSAISTRGPSSLFGSGPGTPPCRLALLPGRTTSVDIQRSFQACRHYSTTPVEPRCVKKQAFHEDPLRLLLVDPSVVVTAFLDRPAHRPCLYPTVAGQDFVCRRESPRPPPRGGSADLL
ncbi:uncharacterized protein PSFLO_04432 [Pseudozyma flocculosa]|uniref:Uncharacterized protein n=1 Tax=Pseudozyma flocculosa TaxID=84751 RepID=A0A5C3F361_9BASI|nr:uncharacterized protein PSFLO_04432 [Pseudozyma flocculosa]